MSILTNEEITARLQEINEWEFIEGKYLYSVLQFNTFKDAFSMMTRIAFEAEQLNHHPEWTNVYNMIYIKLSTHDAGGVTEKDFELAKIIDGLVS